MRYGICKFCNQMFNITDNDLICYHKLPNDKFNNCCGAMNNPIENSIFYYQPIEKEDNKENVKCDCFNCGYKMKLHVVKEKHEYKGKNILICIDSIHCENCGEIIFKGKDLLEAEETLLSLQKEIDYKLEETI